MSPVMGEFIKVSIWIALTIALVKAEYGCEKVIGRCPKYNIPNDTILPNPDNCTSYCVCDNGRIHTMPCPDGLEFSATTGDCDWPSRAGCSISPVEPNPPTVTSFPLIPTSSERYPISRDCQAIVNLCPAEEIGNATLLPNPYDCNSYCACDWGRIHTMPCPSGLEFNAVLRVCDWPDRARCSQGPSISTSRPPYRTTPTRGTTSAPVHPTNPPSGGCNSVVSLCPAVERKNATLLPNPDDCHSYCACDWGRIHTMPCPSGLEFNAVLRVCDWPDRARCSQGPSISTSRPPYRTTPTRGTTSAPVHPTNPPSGGCNSVVSLCPAVERKNATLLPNPVDCHSYCACDWGRIHTMPCPSGLEFNAVLRVCDWPDRARCSQGPSISTSRPPYRTTPTRGTTSTPVHPTNPPSGGCNSVVSLCPAVERKNATLLPNPDDCHSYCACDWGRIHTMPCPSGLEFNAVLRVCDWPDRARCSQGPSISTSRPPYRTTPTRGTTSTPVHPTNPTSGGCNSVVSLCPAVEGKNGTLLPNPDDCHSYCACDWGRIHTMPCPSGLEFNAVLRVCDWPDRARCSQGPSISTSRPPYRTTPTRGTTSTPVHPTNPTSGGCNSVVSLCPAVERKNGTILPNPDDCHSYCACDWGRIHTMPCPSGLEFNAVLRVCDWPDRARCSQGPSISTSRPPYRTTPTRGTTSTPVHPTNPTSGGCNSVVSLCPAVEGKNGTLLPNPDDCHSYCACDWGRIHTMPCPSGLEFNAVLRVCDWPDRARCSQGPSISTSRPPYRTTPTRGTTSTPVHPTNPPSGGCNSVVSLCPAVERKNGTLLPNPDDCHSYCACDWGRIHTMPCPSGLEFNAVLRVCDWPDRARCSQGPSISTSRPPYRTTPTRGTTSAPVHPTNPPSGGCNSVVSLCPAVERKNATLLPNPVDCHSYCACDWGRIHTMPCPSGLEFNAVLRVCDWPDRARCSQGPSISTSRPPYRTTPTRGTTSTPVHPTNPPSGGCNSVVSLCPAVERKNATLLPNPDDCHSYCACDWGRIHTMPCPSGLEFNAVLRVCDWPDRARCSQGPSISTSRPPYRTTPTRGTTSAPVHPTNPPSGGCNSVVSLCPAVERKNATLLPNPDDCHSYCACDWGRIHTMPCPSGLEFNAVLRVCDWPDRARCSQGPSISTSRPPYRTTPTRGTTSAPVHPTNPTSGGCNSVVSLCPAVEGKNATLLPNPDDCHSYCACDWGRIHTMFCPGGLRFNRYLSVCDWPNVAGYE